LRFSQRNIRRVRSFGIDARKANVRDAEPEYAAIVQNAIERMGTNDAIFRSRYVHTSKKTKPQMVKLTSEGKQFSTNFKRYIELQHTVGFYTFHFFHNEFLARFKPSVEKELPLPAFELAIKS